MDPGDSNEVPCAGRAGVEELHVRRVSRRHVLVSAARLGAIATTAGVLRALVPAGLAGAAGVRRTVLIKTSKLAVGKAYSFTDPYTHVPAYLVQPSRNEFRAFSRICTHMGCTVNFEGSMFVCPCHGSEYSSTTGAVERGPAPRPLPSVPLAVQSGEVYVES